MLQSDDFSIKKKPSSIFKTNLRSFTVSKINLNFPIYNYNILKKKKKKKSI